MTMQCNEIEPLLIDYIDAQLSPAARANVEKHLAECVVCKHTYEEYKTLFATMNADREVKPGAALREKFDIMLQSELNIDATTRILKEEEGKQVIAMKKQPSLFLRIAASVILVAGGVLIGMKLVQTKPVEAPLADIKDLKNEVKELKEAMLFNQLTNESASERIKAVNYVEEMGGNPDQKVINALLNTMNQDKNVNVRLAALYSVAKFTGNQIVRDSLVASLPRQKEPIMQIVLINILTEKKETKAIGPIREILSDKKTLQPVKDIAAKGLKLL
ncbi:MAG: zf-HC2 domain-containing protein [Chitinophagaceae bacterium]